MSNVNFRLYGEQIYGLASKYLTEYINPDINKEEFLTNFKNGLLNLNIIGIKKPIKILPQLLIKDLKTAKIEINIPDDKTNFILKLSQFKMMLIINELNDKEIISLIIEKRQKLIDKFIRDTINKIEKKEKSNFLEGLLNSLVKRALDGLIIELNDIEVYLKCNNYLFLLKIDNIIYNENEGIKINNINLIFNDIKNEKNKTDVINKFNIGIIINNSKDNKMPNSLKINLSDIYLEINSNVYNGVMNVIKIFKEIDYKKRYLRYNKLIDFYKPKKNNDKKQYYQQLWFWAIKTVIKLQKYKSDEKIYILDFINSIQTKYTKKYINYLNDKEKDKYNDKDIELINNNLIFPDEIVLLQSTKDKVEQQLLENKKGNGLANAFKFFFGGGGDDENKNELTEEEKQSLNDAFTKENIINFLIKKKDENIKNNVEDDENKNEEQIIDKFKTFFNNISFNITLNKIEILLNYIYSKHSVFIQNIITIIDVNKYNKIINYQLSIGDIGYDSKKSIFKNIIDPNDNKNLQFIKNNDIYEVIFGFKNLILNEKIILFIINFYYSLYYSNIKEENHFFIKPKLKPKNKNNKNIFSIIDKIKISNISSIIFINNESNIYISFDIINFIINKTLISFNLNIKDNDSNSIIKNYEIKIIKNEENTKFDFSLPHQLNIIFSEKITESIFLFYWQIKKLNQYYQIVQYINNNLQNNNNKYLYGLIYGYQKLKVGDEFLNKLDIHIYIKSILFEINEKLAKTKLSLVNLTFEYKNKNMLFKLGSFNITANKSAPFFLIFIKLKSPYFNEYEKLFSEKIKKDFFIDINENLLQKNNIKEEDVKIYINKSKKSKIINHLINVCQIFITEIKIYYKSDENIFSFALNKTYGEKKPQSFLFKIESNYLSHYNINNIKNVVNIMETKEILTIEFYYMNKKLEIHSKTPKFILNGNIVKALKDSFDLVIDKKIIRGIIQKLRIKAELVNSFILFSKFNFNFSNICFRNYKQFENSTIFINIGGLLMKRNDNKSNCVLLKEKQINLTYKYKPKNNRKLNIDTTEINIMVSKDDLYQLILSIFKIVLNIKKSKEKKNNTIINNPEKIRNIVVDFKIPNFSLCLCTNNNYRKISELLISSSRFMIKSNYIENINVANEYKKEKQYSVLINKILLKYFDINNNELILLKSGKEQNNQYFNHIELFCNNNKNITLNINKNNIILRGDSFYSLYHYFKEALPLKEIRNKIANNNNNIIKNKLSNISQLRFNFESTKFWIPSTFNAEENLCFNVEKFIVLFNSINNSKFPNGIFKITLSTISSTVTSKNITRKLFFTLPEFLSVTINLMDKNLNLMVALDTLIINLSYTDIATFLRIYYLNKVLIDKEKKNLNINNTNNIIDNINKNNHHNYFHRLISGNLIEKNVLFSGSFNFQSFNITLIDNSSGSYYPFVKLRLSKIYLECSQDNRINSYFNLLLSSYNYISCVWEPTIENIFIQFNYIEYTNNKNKNRTFQIDANKMFINISDMSISFTLNSLNNWIKKLIEEKNNYKNNESGLIGNNLIDFKTSISQSINLSKVTNNKLVNYTGIKLRIIYANNTYYCDPFSEIELEYINEWDVKIYGTKQLSLAVDSNTNFFIPIERICARIHKINNNLYIVSENILSKDRQININVYSPIIFKNKSSYQLEINIFNQNKGNIKYLLDINACIGLPLYYYEPNTNFNFNLVKSKSTSVNYSIDEIVCLNKGAKYSKNIIMDQTILLMSLSEKIPNVKSILINCEYIIINCLPCNIGMTAKGKSYIIEKCSEQYIDFYSGDDNEIGIQIMVNNTTFSSRPKKLFQKIPKENGNFLKFKNINNSNEYFRVSLLIKKKDNKKVIVIYAESILDNKSGVDFYIKSKNICFQIAPNLYLISSKIDVKEASFTINHDFYNYSSKNIKLSDIIHSSPSYILDLKANKINNKNYPMNQIRLIIDNIISYITPKNSTSNKYNIVTMIYRIYSSHRITNLLSTKNFVIASQDNPGEFINVYPMSQINFDFFHRGINTPLMFSVNNLSNNNYNDNIYDNYNIGKFTSSFNFSQIGTYTFRIGENMFNLEIRKSSAKGIIDIFVVETNLENGKIILDNLTNNMFSISQYNYDSFSQIIRGKEKQILNIYDQNLMKFYIQFSAGAMGEFEFIPGQVQQKKIDLGENTIMCLESNGIKMKVSFYYKNVLEENEDSTENFYFCAKLNEVLVSMIGDNEFKNKKLRNYERNEILLLEMNNLFFELKWDKNIGLLSKDILNTNFSLEKLSLYNQINQNVKYIQAFDNTSSPCICLKNEIYHFKNDNVWKIGGFSLLLGNLKLNIDPVFIEEIMDFVKNIVYRMKIKNYNVDKIFLSDDNLTPNKSINLTSYQNKIKEYMESYNKKGLVFHGENFQLPQLRLDFQISKIGLEHLLVNKFGCSSFFIFAAKGLTEQKHSINLEPYTIQLYIGDFKGIGKLIWQRYKHSIKSEFVNIGIKGIIGNISKMIDKNVKNKVRKFINNAGLLGNILGVNNNVYDNYEDESINNEIYNEEQYNRKRIQRAFYGKFKYFKEFNQDDAYYFDLIPKRLNHTGMQFIFTNLVIGSKNNLYVFTNSALLMMTSNVEVYNTIYYFYIQNVERNNNQILINYNQNIDGRNYYQFQAENEKIAQNVCSILIEETAKNKDNFNDI